MNLIKILLFSTLLMFTISGCQGTNSDTPETNTTNPVALPDTNTTLPPIDINATTDVKNLTIINGNRVVITGGKTTRDIYIMAFNSSGSTNTEGNITFQYPSEFIDNGTFYGLIDPGTATIVDGRVHFVYTSPDDITEINGTTAQFLFHDTSNSDVNVSLFVDFNLTGDYVSTVPILQTLVLSDDNITIYSDNQVESLTLLAYSDQSTTNITTTLDIKYPDSIINSGIDIGSLPATLNVIDGKVILNYTGTADLAQTITKLNENNITNPIKVNIFDKITGSNVNLNLNFIANANDPKYKNYFLNIYPQPTLSVLQPASSKVLEVYLEDNSTSLPVANEPVLVEFFDSSKGTLNSFSATTDVNGQAVFNYTAPATISSTNDFTMIFKLINDVNIAKPLSVEFTPNVALKDYTDYSISLVDANRTITTPSQTEVFDIFLKGADGKAAENEPITIDFFDGNQGTVNAFKGVTDANGHVAFNYTAPATNLIDIDATAITFRIENVSDRNVSSTFTVNTTTTVDPKYSNYVLTLYPTTPEGNISIVQASQIATIDAYLEDSSTQLAVANETIVIDYIDPKYGSLNSFSGTTDGNGHVAFTYTAPSDINGLSDLNITLKLKEDVNKSKNVVVQFDVNGTIKDYSKYTISLVDVNRTIIQASQLEIYNLYVEDNSTGVVKAAEGDTVIVDYFNGVRGTMDSFTQVTDATGRVTFTYTAPADLTDLNSSVITFRIENTTISNNSVSSVLTVDTNKANVAKLQLATSSITLSQNAEAVSIDVLAFNGNNEAYGGTGLVTVIYPTEITDDNVSGGQFVQSSVEIVNGKASFSFIGPDPLTSDVGPLNFTFSYSGTSDINTTLSVYYEPDIPKIVVDDGNITVTKNGEVVSISLSVYDKYNSAYEGGNIKIIYPDTVVGSDIGSFDTSSSAVVNGKVNFVYTASNPLDLNGTTLNFKFYHDSEPIRSQKEFTVTINADPNQVVLTNYQLNGIYDSSMSIETTKGMTFFVEDDLGNAISDSNVTSMTISLLNSNLGLLRDSADRNGSSLDFNSTNNVQVNLESKTLSGLIPIQVYTEFKDANNQDKNLTKVFNVVILSGPPTAMSLSYAGTTQESANAKFIENWVLTVTDKYNNLVNTTPSISTGMITGYADANNTSSNAGNYLYFNSSINDGNLTNVSGAGTDTFTSSREAFSKIDLVNDTLVLFGGTGYVFDTYGKWDIDSKLNTELTLTDDYNGSNATGLGYAVGHNFRNEVCDGSSVVANVYAKDNNNILDTTGSMIIQVEYDYYLVGKSTVLWANLVGQSNGDTVRTGIGKKITLRGNGINGESYDYAKGYEGVVTLSVKITDTVEYYKNTNFDYVVKVTGDDTNWTISSTSMDPGLGITACVNGDGKSTGGVAYVDVNITSPALNAGTVSLENVLVRPEF